MSSLSASLAVIVSGKFYNNNTTEIIITDKQESSAKLTNQRVSYAFTSSPFNFHACHILPASKFQYSYSCILLIFYRHQ